MDSRVICGDSLYVLPTLDAESVDAIVCDPPYGLSFMGKDWDHGVPGEAFWREALRVAKPGAHLVAFGGTRTHHRLMCAIEDAGWEIRDCLSWIFGSGFPKSHNLDGDWKGWGTALKPAYEPIILARKPLVGTVAANVAQYGTGAVNVDGTRIWAGGVERRIDNYPSTGQQGCISRGSEGNHAGREYVTRTTTLGRWPANVVLDEEAAAQLGEPSRFFYTAKASRREREAGLEGMPRKAGGVHDDDGHRNPGERKNNHTAPRPTTNHHPTVKPIALMRWLCRLVTPPNGLVLDPFTGSGSTGCAAVLEGFRFLGVEREPEYAAIAEKRIAHWAGQRDEAEPSLFGG